MGPGPALCRRGPAGCARRSEKPTGSFSLVDVADDLGAWSQALPLNIRFAQPGRAWGEQVDHTYPAYPAYDFPFAYAQQQDPLTGRTQGLLAARLATLARASSMSRPLWRSGRGANPSV